MEQEPYRPAAAAPEPEPEPRAKPARAPRRKGKSKSTGVSGGGGDGDDDDDRHMRQSELLRASSAAKAAARAEVWLHGAFAEAMPALARAEAELAVGCKVILTAPCIFCMRNH
jgi:hypothetical protein